MARWLTTVLGCGVVDHGGQVVVSSMTADRERGAGIRTEASRLGQLPDQRPTSSTNCTRRQGYCCAPEQEVGPGGLAERWGIDLVAARMPVDNEPTMWAAGSHSARRRALKLRLWWVNLGKTPTANVKVVLESQPDDGGPAYVLLVVPETVAVFNSNYPDGYTYSDEAVQRSGSEINVDILGTYAAADALTSDSTSKSTFPIRAGLAVCTLSLVIYATPEGRGAVSDSVVVEVDQGVPCN